MNILDYLKSNYLIFDGAMGSLLQQGGLKAGELPETLNITKPELIEEIHYTYLMKGSNIVLTNTFGANPLKYNNQEYSLKEVIKCAIKNARKAVNKVDKQAYVAYDIGPLGTLLKPSGTLSFEEAYQAFKEVVVEANKYDIDVFVVETISDLMEAKAAVLAIKENSIKPVFVTMTFEETGRTLCGNDICSIVNTLEGLRVDALGLNCSFGPKEMLSLVKEFEKYSSTLLMVQPNAGMPILNGTDIAYDIDANDFLKYLKDIIKTPIQLVGGCCGTSYEHIELLAEYLKDQEYILPREKDLSIVCSGTRAVEFTNKEIIQVGERINPTGKSLLKEALLNEDYNFVIKEAIKQEEEGAHILDVNVGIPKTDEVKLIKNNIEQIQAYSSLPLQVDSSSPKVIEAALRVYNGKAIINSVNGKQTSLDEVLPLVAKYGGMVIGLCIDENGLATSVDDKVKVATKIVNACLAYGIKRKDIIIDALTLTASAQQADVKATLDAITIIKRELNVKTILGASNVSFGLPNRDLINSSFLSMAAYAGLDACIINTGSKTVTSALGAAEVLLNMDQDSVNYLTKFQDYETTNELELSDDDLQTIIIKGLKDEATKAVTLQLKTRNPLDIIENDIVKALDYVGNKFEKKELFLPQLIQSAQTVSVAFEEIKKQYLDTKQDSRESNKIILATVKGDVHDIGKNIVKVLLENYGFEVIDLGKDVTGSQVIEALKKHQVKLVGLSALMTTTVLSMEEIINQVNEYDSNVKVIVGGAVLTEEYAKKIKADYYCKDALEGVKVAKKFFGSN